MYAFDDVVTAPLHGFAGVGRLLDAREQQAVAARRWHTYAGLNATNDPFIPASSLPGADEASRIA